MTYKEVNYMIDDITWSYGGKSITKDDIIECRETCHKALEKQIPKKPIPAEEQDIRYNMKYACPSCGKYFVGTGIADYCYHCGQALDWREAE